MAHAAAIVGALGAAGVLLARWRWALIGSFGLLALAEAGLLVAKSDGLGLGGAPTGAVAAAVAIVAVVLAAGAWALVRWPGAAIPALVLAAPFRLPIDFDTSNEFLVAAAEPGQLGRLLPLYVVLAAAVLALAWRVLTGGEARALPRLLAIPAAAFLALAAVSITWTTDLDQGTQVLIFFLLPFAALVATVSRAPFPESLPRTLAIIVVGLASLFAAVGIAEAATHELLFFAPNLELSNENADYFRVTSLFGDPSLYGRHVVLGIAVLLVLLATRKLKAGWAILLVCFLWAGLFFSYSQSSMAALVAVTLLVAAVTGGRGTRLTIAGLAVVGVLVVAGLGAAAAVRGDSLKEATSDRSQRVEDTTRVIAEQPIAGVGLGSQPEESKELAGRDEPTTNFVSHTTPLTVTAELGAIGVLIYLALLVCGVKLLEAVRRRAAALGLALEAALVAVFVHALFYAGFVEDPVTWVALAIGASYLVANGAVGPNGALEAQKKESVEAA